jgi:GT2 family glycosyltransferase
LTPFNRIGAMNSPFAGPDKADPLAASMAAPRATVIIPHYNMPDALARCLRSITSQAFDGAVEIIVVDNGSKITPEAALVEFPQVRLLSEKTPGPGPARNTGVRAARAPVLVFIDADCRAEQGWLNAAVNAVESRENRGVVGGDVCIDIDDTSNPTALEVYEAFFAYRQRLYIEQHGYSGTGNLAMHRDVHEKVGPFVGISYAEDVDWGRRATAAGYQVSFVENMVVYHPARPDLASLLVKWQRHIAHFYEGHIAEGRPRWQWLLRALMMPPSILVDGTRLLLARQERGLPAPARRWGGVQVLASVRMMRMREMLRILLAGRSDARAAWQDQS